MGDRSPWRICRQQPAPKNRIRCSTGLLAAMCFFFSSDLFLVRCTAESTRTRSLAEEESKPPDCKVEPEFYDSEKVDVREAQGDVPNHVKEFDNKKHRLPKYPSSDLLLVSVTSNQTHQRRLAQEKTFGRVFDIQFINTQDLPVCVLCQKQDQKDECHCPTVRDNWKCGSDIFFDKGSAWWCSSRRKVLALKMALEGWKGNELPKWLQLLSDNTFVNPINAILLVDNLDPEIPLLIGDDWGGFAGSGSGVLFSRGLLKLLVAAPKMPKVTYNWKNGTTHVEAKSQLDSCFSRLQGGAWCYFHGDWAISECVKEVGVNVTNLGGSKFHEGFFSQELDQEMQKAGINWFGIKDPTLAHALHRSHGIGFHANIEQMYDIFYKTVVPFYQDLYKFL